MPSAFSSPLRVAAAALAVLVSCGALAAQQQPQEFRAAVETVRVDAVVTDGDGNFIDDLRADEFTLFEDGEQREIVTVELVDLAARQVRRLADGPDAGAGGASPGAAAAAAPAEPALANGERAAEMGAVIFLVDLPGLTFKNSITFAESMERVFGRMQELSLPYAIYLVDMAGRLREIQPLTDNMQALREGAGAIRETPASVSRENFFYLGALDADAGPMNRVARGMERGRTIYTYGLLRDFVDSLAHRSGRTALVWVSTGVDLTAYETIERPYRITGEENPTPGARFRNYSPDLDVLDYQEQLHRAANAANVSIYSVDPTTLADFYITGGSLKRRDGGAEDARGNSLRNAAHATGGDVFIGWTELDRVLVNIERDAGRFYLLSYMPPPTGIGEYHEIRVEVSRPGSDVRARQGYTRYTAPDRLARTVRSALDLPGTVSGFDVVLQGVRAREADGQALLVLDAAVRAEGSEGRSLLAFSAVRAANGELVATVENQRLTPALRIVPTGAGITPAGSDATATAYWTHRSAHRLPPGDFDVSVAVLDPATERIGAARIEVVIEDAAGAWDTSDPWLVVEAPDGSTSPVIDGRVPEGGRVFMYVEVYNGANPEVGGRVVPYSGSVSSDAGDADVVEAPPANRTGPSIPLIAADGVHRASIPVTALPAGHYLLDFYIDDIGAGRSKSVRLPLEVVASQ